MSPHPPEDMSSMFQFYGIMAATCVPTLPDTAEVIPFIFFVSQQKKNLYHKSVGFKNISLLLNISLILVF